MKRADDRDFKLAVEEALQLVNEAQSSDAAPTAEQSSLAEDGSPDGIIPSLLSIESPPKLSLVHGEDEEGPIGLGIDVNSGSDQSSVEDLVLCNAEATTAAAPTTGPEALTAAVLPADSTDKAEAFVQGDQSATEDLILCESPAAHAEMLQLEHINKKKRTAAAQSSQTKRPITKPSPESMPTLPPRGDIAKLGVRRSGKAPERIGRGKLVPTRLTWKPGDPFRDGHKRSAERFSWEAMLTSACITAACGLLCVWLLHSILI